MIDFSEFIYDPKATLDKPKIKNNSYQNLKKYEKVICEKTSNLDIDLNIADNVQLRLITDMAINALVVIEKISNSFEMDEVFICVYRINQKSVNWIKQKLKDKNIRTTILLSNFFLANKRYEQWFENILSLQSDNFIVKTGCLHAKIFCCKTKCGKYFVFEGSGNLSDNSKLEQYIFEQNVDVYNFHKDWMINYGG